MDLVVFLTARLAEDEAVARDAAKIDGERWNVAGHHDLDRVEGATETVSYDMVEPVVHHVARHDPARVLREVAAKRAILAEHYPIDVCDAHDGSTMKTVTCPTLSALATVYPDHADFNPEWAT
jgi:hypothetical protein